MAIEDEAFEVELQCFTQIGSHLIEREWPVLAQPGTSGAKPVLFSGPFS